MVVALATLEILVEMLAVMTEVILVEMSLLLSQLVRTKNRPFSQSLPQNEMTTQNLVVPTKDISLLMIKAAEQRIIKMLQPVEKSVAQLQEQHFRVKLDTAV